MLRRLEKRIFVPLPDTGARLRILNLLLDKRCGPEVSLPQYAERTAGYSGACAVCWGCGGLAGKGRKEGASSAQLVSALSTRLDMFNCSTVCEKVAGDT